MKPNTYLRKRISLPDKKGHKASEIHKKTECNKNFVPGGIQRYMSLQDDAIKYWHL